MTQPVLETRGLTIRFGGHVAVDAVSCRFEPGTLTAIVGPNGAGKTTYFNLISGQLPASGGQVLLHGEDVTRDSAPVRTRKGMGRAFQLTNLFPNLTVLENVRLAVQARAGLGLNLVSMWSSHAELTDKAGHYLGRVALADRHATLAAELSHGDQRKLEVAILLALEPGIFMFDEPTAGMSVDEVPVILDLIHEIKQQKDKTVLLVEHKMDVVRSLADRIIVLHQGELVADGLPAEVIASPVVQEAYLGVRAGAENLLALAGVHTHIGHYHILQGVDLVVPRGELTMLLGRNGAGKTTALRTILGLWRASAGAIRFESGDITQRDTPAIANLGIAYVPESMGIFAGLTVRENLVLAARSGPLDERRLDWIFRFFPPMKQFWQLPAGLLSGGQKQMLSISRAIVEPRKLVLIDEPTKGLAPAIINNLIAAFAELKKTNTTILMVEQNFHAAKSLGDSVAVMDAGRIVHAGRMAALAADAALQTKLLGLSLEAHQ